MVGQQKDYLVTFRTVFHSRRLVNHLLDDFAIMAITDGCLGISHGLRRCCKVGSLDNLAREIYIEVKSRHNDKVVPKLVFVLRRAQFRKQVTHRTDYGMGTRRALFAVGNRQAMVNHPLYIPAIFRKHQLPQPGIVVQHNDSIIK